MKLNNDSVGIRLPKPLKSKLKACHALACEQAGMKISFSAYVTSVLARHVNQHNQILIDKVVSDTSKRNRK